MSLRLSPDRSLVLDGAMGTELIARGLDARADLAERWVLDRPDAVREIHRGYVESGAEVLQTCTFGALRARLAPHRLAERLAEVCARGVSLAKLEAGRLPVVASLGPTGLARPVLDAETAREIAAQVAEAAAALAGAGADALHLETQYHPGELVAAAAGARRGAPDLPLWISVTVALGDGGLVTPHGVPLARMLAALREAAPDAIGVNCSLDGERMRDAVERLVGSGLGPVVARPQARISEKCATGRSQETPSRFATHAAALFAAGAAAVGGCCGTHAGSIAALAGAVRATPATEAAS